MSDPPKEGARPSQHDSGPPVSAPVGDPQARVQGSVRAALAAVRNLETLLGSPRASARVLREVGQELPAALVDLRATFAEHASEGAERALSEFVADRTAALEAALAQAWRGAGEIDAKTRLRLERDVHATAAELDAAGELIELALRARSPKPTELSARELARAAVDIATRMRRREEMKVRIDLGHGSGTVTADARAVAQLLVTLAAFARRDAAAPGDVVMRLTCDGECTFVLEPATAADAELAFVLASATTLVPPAEAITREAASAMGGRIELRLGRATLTLPRLP